MIRELTEKLHTGVSLSAPEVNAAVDALVDDQVAAEPKADFLIALARKGESPDEIAEFVRALRARSIAPPVAPGVRARGILDVVGTGGDRLRTINLSTAAALIAAAAGVPVAKHGNRAVTSQSGSADVLEALGIPIDLGPEEAAQALETHGFAFFFAPRYHPAFKAIAPARKLCAERGQRTLFNFLGPLLNPVRPNAELMGVARPELCSPLARVLQSTGVNRGMVVCGRAGPDYLDELSILGDSTVAEFYHDRGFHESTLSAAGFPVASATLADLQGGDRATNAAILRGVLGGETRGPQRDAVVLNAAAALMVADRVRSMGEGWELAVELIDSGRVRAKLNELARPEEVPGCARQADLNRRI